MILKNKVKEQFSIIDNNIISDSRLTDSEFRLYCYLLSLPESWNINNTAVRVKLKIGSADTLSKRWKKLESLNLIKRTPKRENGKFLGYDYELLPYHTDRGTVDAASEPTDSSMGGGLSNTISSNTNILNKNKVIELLDFLNFLTGREGKNKFKYTVSRKNSILARLKEHSENEIKEAWEFKCVQWMNTEWEQYLNPETLTWKSKLQKYINQVELFKTKPSSFPKVQKKLHSAKDQNLVDTLREMI